MLCIALSRSVPFQLNDLAFFQAAMHAGKGAFKLAAGVPLPEKSRDELHFFLEVRYAIKIDLAVTANEYCAVITVEDMGDARHVLPQFCDGIVRNVE